MNRSSIVILFVVALTATGVLGQARLLPPIALNEGASQPKPVPPPDGQYRAASLGAPVGLSDDQQGPAKTAQPHQMYGREPAHGTETAGEARPMLSFSPIEESHLAIPLFEMCGPAGRFWAELDALSWWVTGDRVPALVTTSPNGTPQNQAGVLGTPGVLVLAGNRDFNNDARAGFRMNAGYWFDPLQTIGFQVGGFLLENGSTSPSFLSSGSPILARPYNNSANGQQTAELIAFPGTNSGSVVVSDQTSLDGWNADFRQNACCCCGCRIDALFGYRQLQLSDHFGVEENMSALTSGSFPVGTQVMRLDRIDTANQFYGADMGFIGEYRWGGWVFEGLAKMAVGWNSSHVSINGITQVTTPNLTTTAYPGGLLALPTNIGYYHNSEATLIPELGVNVAYDVNDHLRVRGGYSFLYWDHVDRPGQQIDTTISPNQVPPPSGGSATRPLPTHDESELFIQGVNVGVEVRY